MRFHTSALATWLSLTALSSAAPYSDAPPNVGRPRSAPSSSSERMTCYNKLTTKSALWNTATTTSISYHECTSTKTSTVVITTTPATPTSAVSSTVTNTSTAATTTLTATSTVVTTSLTTSTTISTATSVSTSTTTSVVASTVPVSAAFTPVQSSLAGSSYSGDESSDPIQKRAAQKPPTNDKKAPLRNTTPGFSSHQYPAGVNCIRFQPNPTCSTVVTKVTKTATASTPPPTTITTTFTSSSTVFPSATTTTTTTSTSISTSVATSITTTMSTPTLTDVTTTALYAACATNNIADNIVGSGLYSIGTNNGNENNNVDVVTGLTTAYNCCAAAMQDTNGAEIWTYNYAGGSICYVYYNTNGVCSQSAADNQWNVYTDNTVQEAVGNEPCGLFNQAQS